MFLLTSSQIVNFDHFHSIQRPFLFFFLLISHLIIWKIGPSGFCLNIFMKCILIKNKQRSWVRYSCFVFMLIKQLHWVDMRSLVWTHYDVHDLPFLRMLPCPYLGSFIGAVHKHTGSACLAFLWSQIRLIYSLVWRWTGYSSYCVVCCTSCLYCWSP